jgi:hypothetical protein
MSVNVGVIFVRDYREIDVRWVGSCCKHGLICLCI